MAPRSRAQLAEKMAAKDVPESVALDVLDRFEEVGLVDDKAFAQGFVTARQANRGRRALAQELRHRGIDDETAGEALEVVDDEAEEVAARALLRRPVVATRGMDRAKRQRRLVGLLARRGFNPGLVVRVVRDELGLDAEELEAGEPDTGELDPLEQDPAG